MNKTTKKRAPSTARNTRAAKRPTRQARQVEQHENVAKLAALSRSRAVTEYALDGSLLWANDRFLALMGYRLDEVQGKPHSMFVAAEQARGDAYRQFWQSLNDGQCQVDEYKRIARGGREIWVHADYNPILDDAGKPFKIVEYADDITQEKLQHADFSGQIAAIHKSQAVIAFNMDGTILDANDNFLRAVGYRLDEIKGKHHSMFVEPAYARSEAYRAFWKRLNDGEADAGEYKRFGKGEHEVWLQATYDPILDLNGKPFKVVKHATDLTQQKLQHADFSGQIAAIHKSQAVIAFNMDGTILDANDNFLRAVGYRLDEIKGKHHSMFVEPAYARSEAYRVFWKCLNDGQAGAGEYKRLGKGEHEVWLQATYNPILDLSGKPFKVVKYATDVTERKLANLALNSVIAALSSGDLTATMQGEYQGEFAALRDQLNSSMSTLSTMVQQIGQSAETINSGAHDIAEGNSNLNTRTQEQSSALEETASSLEELTATVKQNANNANQANQLAAGAQDAAEKGGQVVNAAVTAMSAITEASKKVADIIGVIEQIAFQTNMLALNAAVEAARAGDQGRGFAVVAAEVRTLAQRSASAAKEIKALIQDSQEKVEQGAKLVNRSGETLSEIVASVKKVGDIIGEIDAASEQQAAGIDQINSAVAQMDKNTQQNAAMVEQATAAAESMTEQARNMAELVRFFKVSGELEGKDLHAALRAPAVPKQAGGARARAKKSAPEPNDKDKHAGQPMFSTRRPPPPAADSDWKEF
jgi:methyl-accepting chemotaxis protein